MVGSGARYLTVGPTPDLPLFDAGRRRANIQVQDLRSKEAALAYAQTVPDALALEGARVGAAANAIAPGCPILALHS